MLYIRYYPLRSLSATRKTLCDLSLSKETCRELDMLGQFLPHSAFAQEQNLFPGVGKPICLSWECRQNHGTASLKKRPLFLEKRKTAE